MQYDAVNLAEGELSLGLSFLKDVLSIHPIKLVSANLGINLENNQSVSILNPYIIKTIGDFKVGITGVTADIMFNTTVRLNKDIIIHEPLSTLQRILSELKGKVDFIILLSHFTMEGTKNFLTYNPLPEVDVAIAGHGRNLTEQADKVGDTLIVQNSMGGEYLSVLVLDLNDRFRIENHSLENIPLTDEVPEDPFLLKRMAQFKASESKFQADQNQNKEQQGQKLNREKKEILNLSPEAFIKRMNIEKTK